MGSEKADGSLSGKVVVLLGGSGFVGRHLAQELVARGARLRIASRHPEQAWGVKPLAGLGNIQFARIDLAADDDGRLAAVMAGADAVVNLAGAFAGNLDAIQGKGAGKVAAAAGAAGAKALVHVSAIGADAQSDVPYARTKGEGEAAVLTAFPQATVIRPSILFGPDDMFINRFAGLIAMLPAMPVFAPAAKLQPVLVDDLAAAIANALENPGAHGGKTFDVAGPEAVTMADLNRRIAVAQGRERWFIDLPDAVSGAIAAFTGWLPGAPITRSQWKLLQAGNVASGALPGIEALGVSPRPLGLFLDRWMVRFRKHGRFGETSRA